MTLNNIPIAEQPLRRRGDDLLKQDRLRQLLTNLSENLFALCQHLKQGLGLTHRARHSMSGRQSLSPMLQPFSRQGLPWRLLRGEFQHGSIAGAQNKNRRRFLSYPAQDFNRVTGVAVRSFNNGQGLFFQDPPAILDQEVPVYTRV